MGCVCLNVKVHSHSKRSEGNKTKKKQNNENKRTNAHKNKKGILRCFAIGVLKYRTKTYILINSIFFPALLGQMNGFNLIAKIFNSRFN